MEKKETDFRKTAEKINTFTYKFTKFDKCGWADAKIASPIPFDLVTVETDTSKKIVAWWNKVSWDGFRLKDNDVVVRWRKRNYERFP